MLKSSKNEFILISGLISGKLPLTSWWRKLSNTTVGLSSLISSTHHFYNWHPGSRCGWTCNQLTSKVDGGITGSRQPGFDLPRQQWSLLNRFHTEQGHCGACRRKWRLAGPLRWDSDDVPHCRILSSDKAEWRFISAALGRWRCCFLAAQLWFMTRIREEEVVC